MYFKILKKDIKRKKTMTIIIMVFVMLSAMFIASSVNNLLVALNGTSYYFDKAGIKDFIIATMRESKEADSTNDDQIDSFLAENENVDAYTKDECLYMSKSNLRIAGKAVDVSSSMICMPYNIKQQKFFTENNEEITNMKDGTIYVPRTFLNDNNLKKGDIITLKTANGFSRDFEILGIHKDAFLGSELMGTKRYLFSENDFNDMVESSGLPYGYIFSADINNYDTFVKQYNTNGFNSLFADGQSMLKLAYIMDMIIAAVLLLVSICLIIISVVMLRFIITFTVNEDYKEIGIMKAIGLADKSIRKLYTVKYFAIAIVGSLLGLAGSFPFGNMMLKQVTENMILPDNGSYALIQAVMCVIVALVITALAFACTGKIKKLTPLDAIRSGNNGERFKQKGIMSLAKSKTKPTTFMALNDILNELRKYITLLITGVVGMWLVIMPVNSINTLSSSKVAQWFSLQECDLWVIEDDKISDLMVAGQKSGYEDYLEDIKEKIEAAGIKVDKTFTEVIFNIKITHGEDAMNSFALQSINTDVEKYMYEEGYAPKYENEVALAYTTSKKVHAKVGDTVLIDTGYGDKEFIVSGLYQTMNNMGEGIRFFPTAKIDYKLASGGFGVQVRFDKSYTAEEKKGFQDKIKELYSGANVQTMEEFINSMLGGIADKLQPLKVLILIVVITICVLVVVLMQKMFLIRERGEMGMLKAIGFSNASIIAWQTKRITIVTFIGMLIGTLTATPFSQITSGQVFKIMGASKIQFVINPVEVYCIYPLIVFAAIIIVCILTMLSVKRINVQDMNQSE